MQKKAFIFDMDGLMINSEPLWQQSGVDVMNKYGIPVTHEDLGSWRGSPVPVLVERACTKYKISQNQTALSEEYLAYAIDMICNAKPLMPYVKETLALLANNNIRMAIASASPRYMLENIIESCDIAEYFECISSAHELPYSKPHPAVYLDACEQLKLSPAQCVGLEDSQVGMIAVKAASMTCIAVPDTEQFDLPVWSVADVKLRDLSGVNEILLEQLNK
ncbi:sugar-phosphatase [Cricetibacter osteomyelitidis]|uniref:Sugar-phosphatase n=1 Tax=Cricetibacter osteomyelitidis TaxID=1521931 RepID=A0A4R2SWV9_9PAST|nr:hexitol phosphatase HxpB [Cricetibacter osteomyelitidis]TCP93381.1 sugar-phosphatase [Cricetibacter osteomyelitidis]